MPDDPTIDDDAQDPSGNIRHLRERAKQADEAEARAVEAERRAALAEAGVPTDGLGKLFRDAYRGELSTEAIKAAMDEYGIGQQTSTQQIPDAEREAHQRLAEARGGSSNSDGSIDAADAINAASSPEEVLRIVNAAGIKIRAPQAP